MSGFRADVDPQVAGLLSALDGRRTLPGVADALAAAEHASPEAVAGAVAPIVRRMLEAGYLRLV